MPSYLVTLTSGRSYEVSQAEYEQLQETGLLAGSVERLTPAALDEAFAEYVADPQSLTRDAVADLQQVTQDPAVAALVGSSSSATAVALRAALVPGSVYNNDGSLNTTNRLHVKLTADGTDIDDLIIETVA